MKQHNLPVCHIITINLSSSHAQTNIKENFYS